MMYVGETPWHGLGTKLDKPATAKEAIKAARLDWEVEKKPIHYLDGEDKHQIPDRFAVIRTDLKGKNPVLDILENN